MPLVLINTRAIDIVQTGSSDYDATQKETVESGRWTRFGHLEFCSL